MLACNYPGQCLHLDLPCPEKHYTHSHWEFNQIYNITLIVAVLQILSLKNYVFLRALVDIGLAESRSKVKQHCHIDLYEVKRSQAWTWINYCRNAEKYECYFLAINSPPLVDITWTVCRGDSNSPCLWDNKICTQTDDGKKPDDHFSHFRQRFGLTEWPHDQSLSGNSRNTRNLCVVLKDSSTGKNKHKLDF